MNICDALKNNGDKCKIYANTEKYNHQNKDVYLCKIHVRVLKNNNLKICSDKINYEYNKKNKELVDKENIDLSTISNGLNGTSIGGYANIGKIINNIINNPNIPKSINEVDLLIFLAEKNNNIKAQYTLSCLYEDQVHENDEYEYESMRWCVRCSNSNYYDCEEAKEVQQQAQYSLALRYEYGKVRNNFIIVIDLKKAFIYYKKAANNGLVEAQNHIGHFYCNGVYQNNECIVQKDEEKSIEWSKKAADNGNIYSQYRLIKFCESDYKKICK